jgi:hypothetical protein
MVDTESSSKLETSLRIKKACLESLKSRQTNVVIATFQDIDSLEYDYDLFNLVKYGNLNIQNQIASISDNSTITFRTKFIFL